MSNQLSILFYGKTSKITASGLLPIYLRVPIVDCRDVDQWCRMLTTPLKGFFLRRRRAGLRLA